MRSLRSGIAWARGRTWHWQNVAGVAHSPTIRGAGGYHSPGYLRWIERRWNHRRLQAYKLAHRPHRIYAPAGSVAHYALWNCIHGGEGNSHPSTNHPYSGPLQMTSYWAGYPIYDWASVPVSVVYADAEAQLQIHLRRGDVYPWLHQQWPGTSPPCLGYVY